MNSQFNTKTGFYSTPEQEDVVEFQFNTEISLTDKLNIVNNTVETIITDNGTYMSLAKNVFFKYFVLKQMTDIDFSYIEEKPEKTLEIERFVENTTAFEIVKENTGDLIESLYRSLSHAITSRTGVKEEQNDFVASLAQLVNLVIDKVGQIDISTMFNVAQKLNSVADKLGNNINADTIVESYFKHEIKEDVEESSENGKE